MREVRGNQIAMVFQDPMSSLNPVMRVGEQIVEAIRSHVSVDRASARSKTVDLLESVGIPDAGRRVTDYPHQFSGGMRQRVMLALALSCDPQILVADEPTTALDVTVQAQILTLIKQLRDERGLAVILITHDLGVVATVADRVSVMYAGRLVEEGSVAQVFREPQHPYTAGLIGSVPRLDTTEPRLRTIEGAPPNLLGSLSGCPFRPRCEKAIDLCVGERPDLMDRAPAHPGGCWVERAADG
jgi:oligopeptide/dipeptide ABC transporter ATP-binding protein